MRVQKRYRQGQILKVLAGKAVASQDELRRQLGHLGMRVTQATLSRDLRELRLVKTTEGYRPLATAAAEETAQNYISGARSKNSCSIFARRKTCSC